MPPPPMLLPVPSRRPDNGRASVYLLTAFLSFTAMTVFARTIDSIPVFQMVFIRQALFVLFLLPYFYKNRSDILHPKRRGLHMLRGFLSFWAMSCGLWAVILIPLAESISLQLTEVIIVTVLASFVLREKVGWRRCLALAVGIIGVLIMLRPFTGGFNPDSVFALLSALCAAGAAITVRMGAGYDSLAVVLFWQSIIILLLSAPLSLIVWTPLDMHTWLVLVAMSFVFMLGQGLMTAAFRLGEASAIAPLHYTRLLMMALVGYFFYDEIPTLTTLVGAAFIIASASDSIRQNTRPKS